MNKTNFNEELFKFIDNATCSFTCIDEIKKQLIDNGYLQLYENEMWDLSVGKY